MSQSVSTLSGYLSASVARRPEHPAVRDPGVAEITYRELDRLSDRLRDRLRHLGVGPGDRVGLYLRKSIDAVAGIFAIQKCGAAHVPVDPTGPPARNAGILSDCTVRAVIVERGYAAGLERAFAEVGLSVSLIALDFASGPIPLSETLNRLDAESPAPPGESHCPQPDDLAYILYTSGSTGRPKGVMISQRNATCFVDWCRDTFEPVDDDRFSSHAPFHFDLSVLDIYVPIQQGATLVLVSEQAGKDPRTLARLVAEEGITSWYSTPSILSLLTQFGHMDRYDYSRLRIVHFAGEVFPIKHLRELKERLPHPRYFNLYGPTETNVCTFYEIPRAIPFERTQPFPIGRPCSHVRARVVDPDGRDVGPGDEGELWIGGPGVMQGYWNAPETTSAVFRVDAAGHRWYRTGDIVLEGPDHDLVFLGRRDRMVKKRGYRIELGEIESMLYTYPGVEEAAVVARPDPENGVVIRAFLSLRGERPSLIRMKQFCAEHLISYMTPDEFVFVDALPKTSTDKTDYQTLKEMV
jgi:amino acid adenylation domain-containing protein